MSIERFLSSCNASQIYLTIYFKLSYLCTVVAKLFII